MFNQWNGWAGATLDIDLTTGKIIREPLSKDFTQKYIGGSGFGSRILFDRLKPGIDPLGPENLIIIGQGPLCGTSAPSSGRYELMTKSPLTGIYLRSNGGGNFGPEMKWAGYDLMIIKGISERPVYLYSRYPRASPWHFINQASLDLNTRYTYMKNLSLIHTSYFMRAFRKLHSPTGKPVELCPSGY